MKRASLQILAIAGFVGALGLFVLGGRSSDAASSRRAQPAATHIAVVDLNHIFQHYDRLEELRQEVRESLEAAQTKAKDYVAKARTLDEQLKSSEFEEGSPEQLEHEKKLIQLNSRYEAYKALTTKNLKKQEAECMRTAYIDVQHALDQFAGQNGYTLVLQINRDAMTSDDPSRTAQKLGLHVFRNQGADDITDAVLAFLNAQHETAAPAKAAHPTRKAAPPSARKPAARPGTAR